MDRGLKWLSYTLLTIASLVALAAIAFGTYMYVSHNDKSGMLVAGVGVVYLLVEMGFLILYFRRVKTT